MVLVAQLVRALPCGGRGRGFESRLAPKTLGHRSKWARFLSYYNQYIKLINNTNLVNRAKRHF